MRAPGILVGAPQGTAFLACRLSGARRCVAAAGQLRHDVPWVVLGAWPRWTTLAIRWRGSGGEHRVPGALRGTEAYPRLAW